MMKKHKFISLVLIIFLLQSCEESTKHKFDSEKNLFISAQQILQKNYFFISEKVEKPNQYSTTISLNQTNINKLEGLQKRDKDSLLKMFEEKKIENITLYDSTCFLFLINSKSGFPNSKAYYYLFSKNDDCFKKIKKDFDIIKQEAIDKQWSFIIRRESLAN